MAEYMERERKKIGRKRWTGEVTRELTTDEASRMKRPSQFLNPLLHFAPNLKRAVYAADRIPLSLCGVSVPPLQSRAEERAFE